MKPYEIHLIYEGSDASATKALYDELTTRGPAGVIATNLLRAHKNSHRAKKYRGGNAQGSYRSQAYERKQWSIKNLSRELSTHAGTIGLTWGWGVDAGQQTHSAVLYVDLPSGQVSFHTMPRGDGPDYAGTWDGIRGQGAVRIAAWAAKILSTPRPAVDQTFNIEAAAARLSQETS